MINDIENLFMYLLTIYMFFLKKKLNLSLLSNFIVILFYVLVLYENEGFSHSVMSDSSQLCG